MNKANKKVSRPTFYMSEELFSKLVAHSKEERTTRSRLIVDLLNLLLMSPIGQKLQESAKKNRRTLIQELERNLVLFNEKLPTEEISRLAEASHRTPDEMLIYFLLLGLASYRTSSEVDQ